MALISAELRGSRAGVPPSLSLVPWCFQKFHSPFKAEDSYKKSIKNQKTYEKILPLLRENNK